MGKCGPGTVASNVVIVIVIVIMIMIVVGISMTQVATREAETVGIRWISMHVDIPWSRAS